MTTKRKHDHRNPFGQFFDMLEARRRREEREGCIIFLVLAGVTAILFTVIGIVFVIAGAVERANVTSAFGDTLANLCNPAPIGITSLANLPEGMSEPVQLLLLTNGSTGRHRWHGELPAAWRAEAADAVDLVGCVNITDHELETCSYVREGSEGDLFTIEVAQVQYTASMVLVNPVSARPIAEYVVEGDLPPPCPDDYDAIGGSRRIEGVAPTLADFAVWLEGFLFPAN